MSLNDPVYCWWTERTDESRLRLRNHRFSLWIDDVLISSGYPARFAAEVKVDTLRYLDDVTLSYDGSRLRECTGGFLDERDDYDLPLTRQPDDGDVSPTGQSPPAELQAYVLRLGFASYVAAVSAYFAMTYTKARSDRITAAERFLSTLTLPLTRVLRACFGKTGESLIEETLMAIQFQARLHRGLAEQSFESFGNALAYAMRTAKNAAAEAVRNRKEFTHADHDIAEVDIAEDEGGERPDQRQSGGVGRSSRSKAESSVLDDWPELYDALFPVAASAADALPGDQAPRTLVQLMLGGVYHKSQNTDPWSKLPWGIQPARIRAVAAEFGPNWHRQTERRVDRLMRQFGYLQAIVRGLVSWKGYATSREFDEELPNTVELRQIDEFLEQFQNNDVEVMDRELNNRQMTSKGKPFFPGWECFTNVAGQATRDLVAEVVVPQRPSDLPGTADGVTLAQLETWLGQTVRLTPPQPTEWAWIAQALWGITEINRSDGSGIENSLAITGAEA